MSYRVCEETGRPGILTARNRWVRTLAEDVGRSLGYTPHGLDTSDAREQDIAAEVASVPHGWRAIAAALKGVVAEQAPFAVLRHGYDGAGLAVEVWKSTKWTEGAGDCARALAVRTNPVTGEMLISI